MAKGTTQDAQVFELSPGRAKDAAKLIFKVAQANALVDGDRRAPMFWGQPGISKSAIIRQLAKEMNYKLIDVRLSQMAPEDLRGIPAVFKDKSERAYVEWALPQFLPKRDIGSRTATLPKDTLEIDETLTGTVAGTNLPRSHYWDGALVLFDEMPNADPSVQAASYQLVLDGKLGDYVMPANAVLMAAGNRETDKGNTFPMPSPLANRFTHFFIVPNFEEFNEWAFKANIHPSVIGFLNANKTKLNMFDPSKPQKAFATNRTWHMASDYLWEQSRNPIERVIFRAILAGTIGSGVETEFDAFTKLYDKLPDPGKILDGHDVEFSQSSEDVGLAFAIGTSLTYELYHRYEKIHADGKKPTASEQKKFNSECDNYLKFLLDRVDGEIIVMATKTALVTNNMSFKITELTEWKRFSKQYAKAVLQS